MSGDQLVFDMSSAPEGQASIFVRKDYLSLMDSNSNSYVSNNVIIESSMLANSNRYCDYKNSYLLVPLLTTFSGPAGVNFNPATPATSADCVVSLKNFYSSIIHSIQIDMNGSTISQTVPFIALYNAFKLCTTLSYQDAISQGSSIGFWMDNSLAVSYTDAETESGIGTTNNRNAISFANVTGAFPTAGSDYNDGFYKRQSYWNFDRSAIMSSSALTYGDLISEASVRQVWKSYIFNKTNAGGANGGVWQCAITATIYLKHISDFFMNIPLLKGVYFRMSIFINQPSVTFDVAGHVIQNTTVNSPLGGISPLMIASAGANEGSRSLPDGVGYTVSLCVGATCLNTTQTGNANVRGGPLAKGVQLIVPSYIFNPIFESAYISSEIKHIAYESQYNYNIMNIPAGQTFTQNLTNGIANIKSLLYIPFYTSASNAPSNFPPIQSPFDPAGGGTTSPFCYIGMFQSQLSGQNVLYNQGQYLHSQFLQQTQGVNAVNAGLTDGLTSGMISRQDWETSYCYWYLDCSRMLPVEEAVPKSVSVSGQNLSTKNIDLYCFITYAVSIDVSVLSGARV